MRKRLLPLAVGIALLGGIGAAAAQSMASTPPAWTDEHGTAIRTFADSQKNPPYFDPNIKLSIGLELPNNVTLYPVPETLKIPSSELFTYGVINDRTVVVDRSTRKIVHIWEK
ncbi:MAG: DUF1236 domain-containing protein [Alphaproteobacteria bacterium]|nr:DUF1236 domain-containing protein [Alphaproteobacteria bacterium]